MKHFISILKPGIIFGNLVTLTGGFFLASTPYFIDFRLLMTLWLAMALIIGSGCIFNNYIDRDIDGLMERTRNRALVQGLIPPVLALIYAIFIGLVGFLILYLETNLLSLGFAALGFFVYVIIYSLLLKRRSTLGVIIGGIAGAMPPVVGYCALTHRFDLAAGLLFLMLFFWQIPHFYAISIYRMNDFKAAGLPILPLRRSMRYTKISMLMYIMIFTIVAVLPQVLGYAGKSYGLMALILGLMWFYLGCRGFRTQNDLLWARKMFIFSILTITLLSLMMLVK